MEYRVDKILHKQRLYSVFKKIGLQQLYYLYYETNVNIPLPDSGIKVQLTLAKIAGILWRFNITSRFFSGPNTLLYFKTHGIMGLQVNTLKINSCVIPRLEIEQKFHIGQLF